MRQESFPVKLEQWIGNSAIKSLFGRIRIERIPRSNRTPDSLADDDYPAIAIGPDGRVWVGWIAHG